MSPLTSFGPLPTLGPLILGSFHCLWFCLFGDRVSLLNVALTALELTMKIQAGFAPPTSTFQVVGLRVCATMPGYPGSFRDPIALTKHLEQFNLQ